MLPPRHTKCQRLKKKTLDYILDNEDVIIPQYVPPLQTTENSSVVMQANTTEVEKLPNAPIATPKQSKLKKNLLDIVNQEVAAAAKIAVEVIPLNETVVQQLLNDFIVFLREEQQKNTASQQLKMARITFDAPNIIHIWCASEINKVMIHTQKDAFFDFVKRETRQTDIQIYVEVDKEIAMELPEENKQRSRNEIFTDMAQQNPLLLELKKSLNLIFE
jgi:hypothetical protein